MGEAAKSEVTTIEQALVEYEGYCEGRLSLSAGRIDTDEGFVQFCGAFEDPLHWTVAYVREEDRSVTPLAVGEQQSVLRAFRRLDARGAEFWDPRQFPPPLAVIGGVPHRFQAAEGRHLVGVVRVGPAGVLLVAVDGALAVVHVEGEATTILHAGPVRGPIKVDVDLALRLARLQRGPSRAPAEAPTAARPVRPDPKTRAHHLRIAGTLPVDTAGGPAIEVVLRGCFGDIVRRAEKLPPRRTGDKRRGLTVLEKLLDYLCTLALEGRGDLVGVRRVIAGKLRARFVDFEISEDALSDAFALLLRVGTCIAVREKLRWTIRLAGLGDPRSELHRQLCKETEQGGWICDLSSRETRGGRRVAGRGRRRAGGAGGTGGEQSAGRGGPRSDESVSGAANAGEARSSPGSRASSAEPTAQGGTAATSGEPHAEAPAAARGEPHEAESAAPPTPPCSGGPVSEDRPRVEDILQDPGAPPKWLLHMLSDAASLAVRKALAGWRADKVVWQAEREQLLARLARAEAAAGVAGRGAVEVHEAHPEEPGGPRAGAVVDETGESVVAAGEDEEPGTPHVPPSPAPQGQLDDVAVPGARVSPGPASPGQRGDVNGELDDMAVPPNLGALPDDEAVQSTRADKGPPASRTPEGIQGLHLARGPP